MISIDKHAFTNIMLKWYDSHKRNFPWHETFEPYNILFTEILLRKTTVHQVSGNFERLICKYKSTNDLLNTSIEELEEDLKPLGMYKVRASQLKQLAFTIKTKYSGNFPITESDLTTLPGVSKYIANAVLCFAFNQRVAIVDTNIARIYGRIFQSQNMGKRIGKKHWNIAERMLPQNNSLEFNRALLDLAALICKFKNPLCNRCPVNTFCEYYKAASEIKGKVQLLSHS